MKKIFIFTFILSALVNQTIAQYNYSRPIVRKKKETKAQLPGSFYWRVGVGYAFPLAGQTIDGGNNGYYNGTLTQNSTGTNYNIKKASFASGFWGYVAGGYMFNPHVGVELGAHIGFGTKYTNEYDDLSTTTPTYYTSVQSAQTSLLLNPALLLTTNAKKANLYARFGMALPVISRIENNLTVVYTNGPGAPSRVDQIDVTILTRFSVGMTSAAGISVKSKNATFFAEVNTLSMSLYAKQDKLNSYTVNGSNVTGQVTNSKINFSYSGSQNATYSIPFSNVGLAVGVMFGIGH